MSKNAALIVIMLAALTATIGMALVSVPGKEDLGLYLLLGAILMALLSLCTDKNKISKSQQR